MYIPGQTFCGVLSGSTLFLRHVGSDTYNNLIKSRICEPLTTRAHIGDFLFAKSRKKFYRSTGCDNLPVRKRSNSKRGMRNRPLVRVWRIAVVDSLLLTHTYWNYQFPGYYLDFVRQRYDIVI